MLDIYFTYFDKIMKMNLLALALILICFSSTQCLFTSAPTRNFTVSGYDNKTNPTLLLDGTGTNFMIWTQYPAHFQIYSINGSLKCQQNSTQMFSHIIWPANHSPIASMVLGGNFYTIDENTCQPITTYNLANITKVIGELGRHMSFIWNESRPILTISGQRAIYQIDLNSSQLINSFSVGNESLPVFYQNTLYSKDMSHLFALTQNITNVVFSLKIWENNNQTNPPVKEINFSQSSFPGQMSNLKESDSGLISVLEPLQLSTKIYTFDASGTLNTKVTRLVGDVTIFINDGNLFDTVAIMDPMTNSLEVIKLDNGQSLQRIYFPQNETFHLGQYQNRVLILLDETGRALTYTYEDDILPPKPDDDDSGSTTWIVIICVLVGVLIIAGAAVFFIRKKKLAQKQSGIYGKLNDQV